MSPAQKILALCGAFVSMLHSILNCNQWVEYDMSGLQIYLQDDYVKFYVTGGVELLPADVVLWYLQDMLGQQVEGHQSAFEKFNPGKAMIEGRVVRCMRIRVDDHNRILVAIK